MSKELTYYGKASEIYAKAGLKGLLTAVATKTKGYILPTLYKSSVLSKLHYPKLKIAYLEVTNKCNLSCRMCIYQKMQEVTGYMSKSLFENCVDQLSQIGIETLNLHFGGESLVHPDFKQYLKYAIRKRNEQKIKNVIWTDNGMLFNQAVADLVVELKVDSIGFSIDGVGEVNDKIRLGANYSIIEKNIKYLISKRGKAKKPEIYLLMCDYGKTEEQKTQVYREWINFVDSITLIPSILPDNTWENREENSRNLKTIKPPAFCSFPFDTMAVSWNGKVTGCCLDYVFTLDLGDATKESLKHIWQGPRYRALRKAVLTASFPVGSPCYKCEFWRVNFEPRQELILNGSATTKYGYLYREIKRVPECPI